MKQLGCLNNKKGSEIKGGPPFADFCNVKLVAKVTHLTTNKGNPPTLKLRRAKPETRNSKT
jgi:hypothetical protein